MNVIKSIQFYINKILSDVQGMKILLLDNETTSIVSAIYTQTYLFSKEVYLMSKLNNTSREAMPHLKCVVLIRPSSDSFQALLNEISDPKYGEYHVYFTNCVKKGQVEKLAEIDEYQVVKEVNEFFADYIAVNPELFTYNILHCHSEGQLLWDPEAFNRINQGLQALLLSLKRRPYIRYDKSSAMAARLAQELQYSINQESSLFDFRKSDGHTLLLVLDRKMDCVTPLLSQWTYQAMVHELLGINNGRVDMTQVPDIRPEMKEIVLSSDDSFYTKNMFLNFGQLGNNIKEYVAEYQSKTQSHFNVESIADMKKFVEEYPEFRKLSGNVSKHVALVSELSRLVDKLKLLEVSELEQNLACFDSHATDFKDLLKFIERTDINEDYKVRLIMLYVLRYQKQVHFALPQVLDIASRNFVSERKLNKLQMYVGAEQRRESHLTPDLLFAKGKNVLADLKGIENVYTQHTPIVMDLLDSIIKGKLKEASFPFVDNQVPKDRVVEIVIFVVNGVTYEEARSIAQFNETNASVKAIIGGSTIHNFNSFVDDVEYSCK